MSNYEKKYKKYKSKYNNLKKIRGGGTILNWFHDTGKQAIQDVAHWLDSPPELPQIYKELKNIEEQVRKCKVNNILLKNSLIFVYDEVSRIAGLYVKDIDTAQYNLSQAKTIINNIKSLPLSNFNINTAYQKLEDEEKVREYKYINSISKSLPYYRQEFIKPIVHSR